MTGATPCLSVVIVSWNGWTHLEACLASLDASTLADREVIVVDNGSTDGTVERLRQHHPGVRLFENAANLGHARGVNQGLERARGRYVLILDSDTEVAATALEVLAQFLEAHPEVAMVAPRITAADGSVEQSARNLPSAINGLFGRQSLLTRVFPNNPFSRRYLAPENVDRREPFRVEQVSAACMMLRRSLIDELGAWDSGYIAYFVDTDFCMRLKRHEKPIFCVPDARVVHHEQNRRGARKSPFRIWAFHQGAYRLYRKHFTWGVMDPRALLAFAALGLRAALLILANSLRRPTSSRPVVPAGQPR